MVRRVFLSLVLLSIPSFTQTQRAAFNGLDQWKEALAASNMSSLRSLYSTDPPAKSLDKNRQPTTDISLETDFWEKALASGTSSIELSTLQEQDKQGLHIVSAEVSMKMKTPAGPRTRYVMEQQAWQQQGDTWRIVVANHSDLLKMRPALHPNSNLYNKDADARAEIKEGVAKAANNHQRVLLVFGANWCYDCHVLDQAFHQADVAPLLEHNFYVVHVDIGEDGKKNTDLAAEYKVPLERGVPALAILGPDGKLLYSQRNGEWESARSLDPDDVITFLNKWKP
jgi:thioredoxin 1